jgi:hypothetical protein
MISQDVEDMGVARGQQPTLVGTQRNPGNGGTVQDLGNSQSDRTPKMLSRRYWRRVTNLSSRLSFDGSRHRPGQGSIATIEQI